MHVERLELRQLLSTALVDGLLRVDGTPQPDRIVFALNGSILELSDNGVASMFDAGGVLGVRVEAGAGDDVVEMGAIPIPATLVGGNGNDYLAGGAGRDRIRGGDGSDTCLSAASNDTIDGGGGDDRNDGGDDNDLIVDLLGNNLFIGCKGNDTLIGGDGSDTLAGQWGSDRLEGGGGNDFIDAGKNNDKIYTGAGNDVILNNNHAPGADVADHDTVTSGRGIALVQVDDFDTLASDAASPPILFDPPASMASARQSMRSARMSSLPLAEPTLESGVLTIFGTSRADAISVTQRGDALGVTVNRSSAVYSTALISRIVIECAGGDDTVMLQTARGTNRCLIPATVMGGNGHDAISGGDGNDLLVGGAGDDVLGGGRGDDNLSGGRGGDMLDGGASDLASDDGSDVLSGGGGIDCAIYAARTEDLVIHFADDLANDGADGEGDNVRADIDQLLGGRGDDRITGNGAANFIAGGAGNDLIHGGGGNDVIAGGDGGDTVNGDDGVDVAFLDDGEQADFFDTRLNVNGYPLGGFVFGDPYTDYSTTSRRYLV